jgi:peptidoglycan hydrolase-like amidase
MNFQAWLNVIGLISNKMNIKLLLATNEVIEIDLEEYLRGVVPAEMPTDWQFEALKAQAVAARSYAAYMVDHPRHAEREAMLCQSPPGLFVHCQAYAPGQIDPRADAAIETTSGIVMVYKGKVVNALYHSDCGGHTKNNEEVFKSAAPVAYLRGVKCIKTGRTYGGRYYFGHRVGMCQHGAQGMAENGEVWPDILRHYYTGVEFDEFI